MSIEMTKIRLMEVKNLEEENKTQRADMNKLQMLISIDLPTRRRAKSCLVCAGVTF